MKLAPCLRWTHCAFMRDHKKKGRKKRNNRKACHLGGVSLNNTISTLWLYVCFIKKKKKKKPRIRSEMIKRSFCCLFSKSGCSLVAVCLNNMLRFSGHPKWLQREWMNESSCAACGMHLSLVSLCYVCSVCKAEIAGTGGRQEEFCGSFVRRN